MLHRYAFVAEGDVFLVWSFDAHSGELPVERMEMIIAGMSSGPKIVEIPAEAGDVESGWTLDGDQFQPPKD